MTTLRTYLIAQSALTDLTSTRIWGAAVYPPKGYEPAEGAAICFNGRGGQVDYNSQIMRESVQFKCYAATALAALTLYGVLVDVLHDKDGTGIRHAEIESTGYMLTEPETGWPFVLVFFTVIFETNLGA